MRPPIRLSFLGASSPPLKVLEWIEEGRDIVCGSNLADADPAPEGVDVVALWSTGSTARELALVERIMRLWPIPLVVFSAQPQLGWLARGVVAVLESPRDSDVAGQARDTIRRAARVAAVVHPRPPRAARGAPVCRWRRPLPRSTGRIQVVAIAASTGGPRALVELLEELPPDFGACVLVVQHMGRPGFDQLVRSVARVRPGAVGVASSGHELPPGFVLLAPPGQHVEVTSAGRVALCEASRPLTGHVPAADRLLCSVASQVGARAAGVILSGMGDDGALGAVALHEAGAAVYAQDEASCAVFGMPRAAIALGAVDTQGTPRDIGRCLAMRYRGPETP